MISCIADNVRERDMDLLFMELFATDHEFVKFITGRVSSLRDENLSVEKVTLSKVDPKLGESDITVVLEADGNHIALLIEDKIDAIAMPEQHARYNKRGIKGVTNHEYDEYYVFIFCPRKYYDLNGEAKQYEYCVFYEDIYEYLHVQDSLMANVCCQLLKQSIQKAKKPPETQKNELAIEYFKQYREFQQSYYPNLDLRTKPGSNGWWVEYGTFFGKTSIVHKTQEGYVDYTFYNASKDMYLIQQMAEWLRGHGYDKIIVVKAGKSTVIRINVPRLSVIQAFEETHEEALRNCFNAISDLSELDKIFRIVDSLSKN